MPKLRVPVNQNDHIQGSENAPIELVEYGDYQCPYCGEAYPEIKALQKKMGKNLKFVFRNFPLTQMHENAKNAALAAEAAGAQGKFWEMHNMLYENQNSLKEENLVSYAEKIGLDVDRFKNDLQNKTFISKVEGDFEGGMKSGVNSTPSFYVNGEKREELDETELMEMVKAVHH